MSDRFHYFMIKATMVYIKDKEEKPRQRALNTVLYSPSKNFTSVMINNSRIAIMQRMTDEMGVMPGEYKDFIVDSISYLGFMSIAEFEGKTEH